MSKPPRYTRYDLKTDLGALAALVAFLGMILSIVLLPGLLADSGSTVRPQALWEGGR